MPRGTPRVWSFQSPPHADHNMIAGPSYVAQPIPPMSENNHKVWTWTPKTRQYHLTISHWSWTTENLELLLFLDQKTLACYRENQLPEREGDTLEWWCLSYMGTLLKPTKVFSGASLTQIWISFKVFDDPHIIWKENLGFNLTGIQGSCNLHWTVFRRKENPVYDTRFSSSHMRG